MILSKLSRTGQKKAKNKGKRRASAQAYFEKEEDVCSASLRCGEAAAKGSSPGGSNAPAGAVFCLRHSDCAKGSGPGASFFRPSCAL